MVVEGVIRGRRESTPSFQYWTTQLHGVACNILELKPYTTVVGSSTFTVSFPNNIEAYNDFRRKKNSVILVLLTLLESWVGLTALHGWHSQQCCGDFGWDKDGGPHVSDCHKMTYRWTISFGVASSFTDDYYYYCSPWNVPVFVEKYTMGELLVGCGYVDGVYMWRHLTMLYMQLQYTNQLQCGT